MLEKLNIHMQENEVASNYKAMHCKVSKSNFLTITVHPMHISIAENKVKKTKTEIIKYFYFHSEDVEKKYSWPKLHCQYEFENTLEFKCIPIHIPIYIHCFSDFTYISLFKIIWRYYLTGWILKDAPE